MPGGRPATTCIHGLKPKGKCDECRASRLKEYHENQSPESKSRYRLKYRFNMSPEELRRRRRKQRNRCKLCGTVLSKPVIDHNHGCCLGRRSCGKCVRGILCISCNAMLGQLSRAMKIGLRKVLAYIGSGK